MNLCSSRCQWYQCLEPIRTCSDNEFSVAPSNLTLDHPEVEVASYILSVENVDRYLLPVLQSMVSLVAQNSSNSS